MNDQVRTKATFYIICDLPFGTPCEHHNCCHFIESHIAGEKPSISWCKYARPVESHINCNEVE